MAKDERKELKKQIEEMDKQFGEFGREEMESLKNEVVAEIRKESFKKELLEELEMRGFRASLRKTAQHPAVLLILGFGLTSLLGSGLTFLWQNKANAKQESRAAEQRDFEQRQNSRQRLIQQKYLLVDEVAKAVAETSTAAEDILDAWDRANKQAYPERLKYWQVEGSRKWRVANKTLIPKLSSTFRDPQVGAIFDKIIEHRSYIGNYIVNLRVLHDRLGWAGMEKCKEVGKFKKNDPCKDVTDFKDKALTRINRMADELGKLMNVMVLEIKVDEQPIVPPVQGSFWTRLFS